jgi:hypothetical protein
MHDVIGEGTVQDRSGIEFLTRDGSADHGEDAGADDRADAEPGERPWAKALLQLMLGMLRFGDQLVNGFAREDLFRQGNAPGRGDIGSLNSNRKAGTGQAGGYSLQLHIEIAGAV